MDIGMLDGKLDITMDFWIRRWTVLSDNRTRDDKSLTGEHVAGTVDGLVCD